jgi:hypothetical protein
VAFISGNTKTDRAMRIRVQAGVGNVSAQTDVVTIAFASEWKDQAGNPVVPAIVCSQGAYASVTSSTAFTLQLGNLISSGNYSDFSIIVGGGSNANAN